MIDEDIEIQLGKSNLTLYGHLSVPTGAQMVVVFAHGSGSGRFSPRNQFVAQKLQKKQLGTLLLDLLTAEESVVDEETREYRFNIDLLAQRLIGTAHWIIKKDSTKSLKIGYFGASTGAAAALIAAALAPERIACIVSRGGRPDLAAPYLENVSAPTLLIVGSRDEDVLRLNEHALNLLCCEKELRIIPNATHLFEERGALDLVAEEAAQWFVCHN